MSNNTRLKPSAIAKGEAAAAPNVAANGSQVTFGYATLEASLGRVAFRVEARETSPCLSNNQVTCVDAFALLRREEFEVAGDQRVWPPLSRQDLSAEITNVIGDDLNTSSAFIHSVKV